MKNILLLSTGGTIACEQSENGLAPAADADKLVSYIPDIADICRITTKAVMSIDSSNMTPELMGLIAETIADNYNSYDGFVVTHGTDTLAYTAAALTLMLINLDKPVILTGSQLPIEYADSDAPQNLRDALNYACEEIRGVYVAFNHKLIPGDCAKKVRTKTADAFESINRPSPAALPKKNGNAAFYADTKMNTAVTVIKIIPGMRTDIFDYVREHYKGVVIECFGLGGLPDTESDILVKIDEMTKASVTVVITTQCIHEGTDLSVYSVGQNLKNLDIIEGGEATTEFLVMKLMWQLAHEPESSHRYP